MKLWLLWSNNDQLTLVTDAADGRVEFRGASDYGAADSGPRDLLSDVLDLLSGPTVSALMAGDTVHLPQPGRAQHDHAFVLCARRWETADEHAAREAATKAAFDACR